MEEETTQTPAENTTVETETTTTAPPAEETQTETTPETEGEATEQQPEASADETEGDAERKPKRAERKIRQLNAQVNQLRQDNQLLQGMQQPPQFPTYQPGEEIAPERLQADVVQTAQAIANLTVEQRLGQERAAQNVERDTEVLPTKYSELDPDSSDFSPELDKAITEEFQERAFRVTGYRQDGQPIIVLDPSVRLADIAKRSVEMVRAVATKSSANMRNALAQSADTNAIKPQAESKVEKPFEELSIQEMEAKLGTVRR